MGMAEESRRMNSLAPRRSVSAVARAVAPSEALQRSLSARADPRRQSMNDAAYDRAAQLRRQSLHHKAACSGSETAADLTAYYSFSRRRGSVASEDQGGLSGFLEYKRLDGSWRPFLFQTIGYQLVVFRVQVTHQVQVMSTDIRDASEIALVNDGDLNNTKLFRLGINNTVITLRAISHHVAMYWVDGLRQLRAGKLPDLHRDRLTVESEDDIFRQIDQMSQMREWRPPPSPEQGYCGLCIPCFGWFCLGGVNAEKDTSLAVAFTTTHSPRPPSRPVPVHDDTWD